MNTSVLSIVMLGLFLSAPTYSDSIYKCSKADKSVSFTDQPCPARTKESLIYKESEEEVKNRLQADKQATIKNLIEGGQSNAAKEYAAKNNLADYYFKQLSIYSSQKVEDEKREAEDDKQHKLALEQQKLALQKQQQLNTQQQSVNRGYSTAYMPYYTTPYHNIILQPSTSQTTSPPTFEQSIDQKLYGTLNGKTNPSSVNQRVNQRLYGGQK